MIFFGSRKKAAEKECAKLRRELTRLRLELKESKAQAEELDKVAKMLVRRDMELMRLNDELTEIDRAKANFITIAAHQLRTPLSITKWTFRMLLSEDFGPLNEEQKQVVEKGYNVNEGMVSLISDLLDVARIETGKFLYRFKKISLADVIAKILVIKRPRAEEKNIQISISPQSRKEPFVLADRIAMETVFENLLNNAIDYTLPGGKIAVSYKETGGFWEVQVKDTGVGIPAHELSKVFLKFFRGANALKLQTSGSGLGLFVSKSIVTAHGGIMGVESEEGKGSTFWFKIPVKSAF